MEVSLYRKNALKTLSVKPAKLGLALVSRNTLQTHVMHTSLGVLTESGELIKALRPMFEGAQIKHLDHTNVIEEFGDLFWYLVILAKFLKVKVPGAKKKIKLQGTFVGRALDLHAVCTDIGDLAKKNFYGPKMMDGEKEVRNPATGEKSMKVVSIVNKDAQAALVAERQEKLKPLVEQALLLAYELCYALTGKTADVAFEANIIKLSKRFPEGFLTLEARENADNAAEQALVGESAGVASGEVSVA